MRIKMWVADTVGGIGGDGKIFAPTEETLNAAAREFCARTNGHVTGIRKMTLVGMPRDICCEVARMAHESVAAPTLRVSTQFETRTVPKWLTAGHHGTHPSVGGSVPPIGTGTQAGERNDG